MSSLTSLQIGSFLRDFEKYSSIEILEGSKETSEIVKIAEAKGINLKNNRDLAGFKAVYGFADRPNYNRDMIPEPELLKSLPSIISKPINIAHERRYVIGHIIDYRYIQKTKTIIVFGVIYKSNFGTEWKRTKREFADGNLGVSWEIHSPDDKRIKLPNGVYELNDIEHAGMALLFKDDEAPAEEGATVLSLARKQMDEVNDLDLVFASKYKDSDIITADIYKEEVEKNLKELIKQEEKAEVVELTKKPELKEETPKEEKSEVVEPKKVIEEKKEEKEVPKEPEVITNPKIKCSNCEEEFEVITGQLEYKCPKCFSILDTKGVVKYPPQIKDFKLFSLPCGDSNYLIIENKDDKLILKCQNETCNKTYEIEFAQEEKNELLDKTSFLYTNTISCIQCGKLIDISSTSQAKSHEVNCPKCKLTFVYNKLNAKKDRQITKITEIIKDESSEKGGDEEVKKPDEKEKEKLEEKKVEDKPKEEVTPKVEEKVETPKEEVKEEKKEAKQVEKVEEEKAEKSDVKTSAKIPEKNSEEAKGLVDIIKAENEAKKTKQEPKEKNEVVVEPKKSAIRRAVRKILDLKKEVKITKTERKEKEDKLKVAIKKVASQLIKAYAEIKKIKSEADEKIKLYKENAKTILKRREELGEEANNLSDKDILSDDKFKMASLKRENSLLKASKEVTDEIIGDKNDEDESSEDINLAKEIDVKAYKKEKKEKENE